MLSSVDIDILQKKLASFLWIGIGLVAIGLILALLEMDSFGLDNCWPIIIGERTDLDKTSVFGPGRELTGLTFSLKIV